VLIVTFGLIFVICVDYWRLSCIFSILKYDNLLQVFPNGLFFAPLSSEHQ
jgi:hypothetical protein